MFIIDKCLSPTDFVDLTKEQPAAHQLPAEAIAMIIRMNYQTAVKCERENVGKGNMFHGREIGELIE